jgi:hypothetical protein
LTESTKLPPELLAQPALSSIFVILFFLSSSSSSSVYTSFTFLWSSSRDATAQRMTAPLSYKLTTLASSSSSGTRIDGHLPPFPLHSRLPSFELAIQYVAALFLFSSPSFPCMWTRWAKKVYPSWIPSPLAEIDTLVVTSLRRR